MKNIPFNKPYITGEETHYINQVIQSGKISGNGTYTQKCQAFFEQRYGIKKALLTTSCTDALEMCALLADIQPGDEVIMPSYTFVSTANAFILRGARIVFADSRKDHPGLDEVSIEKLISLKTKAIVPVHYAGVACDMDKIMALAEKHNLVVIEDAAQAIESFYKGKPLGTIGHLAAFSFHETKNISTGEGGLLAINDSRYIQRAEILWEKGTNRAAFFRGEVNKYGWVDTGSSFLPAEIIAAYLWAQLKYLENIQEDRKQIWTHYYSILKDWAGKKEIQLPFIPEYATNNGHTFYLVCNTIEQRDKFIKHLKNNGVQAVFHYLSLHRSDYYRDKYNGKELFEANRYSDCLVRLPLYYELSASDIETIAGLIIKDL